MQSLAPSASIEAGGMLLRTLLQQQTKARAPLAVACNPCAACFVSDRACCCQQRMCCWRACCISSTERTRLFCLLLAGLSRVLL